MVQVRFSTSCFPGFLLLIVAVLATGGASAQSSNGWSVCNQTSMIVETATARPEGSDVVVEGWMRVRPGECRVVMAAPLRPGPHFLYARSSQAHRGGVKQWTGEFPYCVDAQGSFSVQSPPNCVTMGLEERRFQPVLIESRNRWRTDLKETEIWTMKSARAAGLQRLINDAGVQKTTIDGYIGRSTRNAIATFLRANNIAADVDDEELIDLLETVAIDRARNLGLTFCNRSNHRIWSAFARRRGEGYESRGWWSIEAGACEKVIDEALIATPYFVHAEMETDEGRKQLTGAGDKFCMSQTKFAILDREDCGEAFYEDGLFKETTVPEDGRLVYEFFERDFSFVDGEG